MKTPYQWKSDMKKLLLDFIETKHMTGFQYNTQERVLRQFDEYYYYQGYSGIHLTKHMVNEFIYNALERPSTHYKKEILMKELAEFLRNHGYEAYIPPICSTPKKCTYIPYILTDEEMKRFFTAIDSYPLSIHSNRNTIDPLLFRLLYGSGLRISEALKLKIEDVDLENGILTIKHAKNNKDRLVPIASTLVERMRILKEHMHCFSSKESYFFPGKDNKPIDQSTIYCRFRDYLLMADIPHTSSGPRVHSLRHGFAVRCLKKWVLSGEDLTNIMPYLAAYMGHTDFRATQYYLRLTADLYPDIITKTEAEFGHVIPEGGILQ